MKLNILAAVLGIIFLATGVFAFAFSTTFFSLIGDYYGVFNNHFVKDAGIAFFSSGSLLLLSTRLTHWRVPLTLGGSLFIMLHGALHVQMLTVGMAPTTQDFVKELLLVVGPSILTGVLLALRMREYSQSSKMDRS